MSWKEILIYVLLTIAGILSIYGLTYTRKSIQDNSVHLKIRNIIFYMGVVLGVYGLYELIRTAIKVLFESLH